MTTTGPRVRVLRGIEPRPADIGTVSARAARELVVDPRLVHEATEEGFRFGYDEGFSKGLADSADAIDAREQARGEQLRSTMARLDAAANALAVEHAAVIEAIEEQIVTLACAIATEIVGAELRHTNQRGRDALLRALRFAPEQGAVRARLHPDDVATAGDLSTLLAGRALDVVSDPLLDTGDCVVDIDATRIDARIAPALARIRAVLEGDTE